MYPIIVLEGPDGSGKTTLGNFLEREWGAKYLHATYRFKDRMFTYHWAVLEQALKYAQHQPVILDRWWPSEFIYADVYRGGSPWPMARRMLDRAGLACGVIYVVCLPHDRAQHVADFEERRAAGGEMYDTVEQVIDHYTTWGHTIANRSDVIRYDRFSNGKDMSAFSSLVRRRWHSVFMRIPHWFNDRQFGGNSFEGAKIMVVGERSNPKGRHKVWPFFEHAHSSLWVTEVFEKAGIPEYDMVWANAFDSEGWASPTQLERAVKHLGPRQIIALGDKAEKVLWSAGLGSKSGNVIKLKHPAYVKRFQNGNPADYLNTLKGL